MARHVLIECEAFDDLGGWVADAQFMDQMGSPFLLAHGLGRPVADATTRVTLPAPGRYRLWVRTRDWVANWNAPGAPGRFHVLVNGAAGPTTFGTQGAAWGWQDGGVFDLPVNHCSLALHDLTGFEGRCDALLLTDDLAFAPPGDRPELETFRRRCLGLENQLDDGGAFDLVVVGGGIAGMCAAVSAARLGLKTALVHDRPVPGGNNSPEVRVWLGGKIQLPPWPHLGDLVAELQPARKFHYGADNTGDIYESPRRLAWLTAQENLTLLLDHRVIAADSADGHLPAVVAQHTASARRVRLSGRYFADCTGDAAVGFLAGAEHDITLRGHMGPSNLWHFIQIDRPQDFPRCPWALDLAEKPFPGRAEVVGQYASSAQQSLGAWFWESGFDLDPIAQAEQVRDWNFRAAYGAWDALKNVDHAYPDANLHWMAHVAGPRESRRLLGDVVLSAADIVGNRPFDDACFPCTWSMDLHEPDERFQGGFAGREFISKAVHTRFAQPYWAPYRCLYSRNIDNLFMAGRDISVTHEALGTVRVMRTGGMMGEVVGMAATLCRRHGCTPREVYKRHLPALQTLMQAGVGKGGTR